MRAYLHISKKSSTFARYFVKMRYEKEDIEAALGVLRAGGIIVYPTDTVWGLGCDATNAEAVAKLYALKQREDSKSMLVLLDSAAKLNYYVQDVPETAWTLLEAVSDTDTPRYRDTDTPKKQKNETPEYRDSEEAKPLTIIYPRARNMAANLIAEDGSIGIRITNEPFSKALCAQLRHPIVSTSANISGRPTARFFEEIEQEVLDKADYVCRYRREDDVPCEPSSIIKINEDNSFRIIRP